MTGSVIIATMARTRPPDRLKQIAAAAAAVFADRGYRSAQMSDIAQVAGVSSGSLYNYVESKEALLHLALRHTFGREPLGDPALPVVAPPISEVASWLDDRLDFESDFVALHRALALGGVRLRRVDVGEES